MSYQVLARKWRPKNFEQLMGQEHVVTVLVNALTQQRLHHAYLFTGTRGVGKTTIARIFAKSLNCETGITATPCGTCDVCVDIDQGRFVDLLEIDAASRTKVDDTREILDNVQYAPTRGRYKVYLIDEVHMLSRSSFNALLKTLEEPPEHVKFILATTDPQKLPITVLSRCLQFHLKALTVQQIEDKLSEILTAENAEFDPAALKLLAKAARGSMRDSLSLTDQAMAQGQGNITLANLQQMLGGIDNNWVYKILIALIKQDSKGLMSLSLEIASYAPNYGRLFAELIQLLHQVAMYQVVQKQIDLSIEHSQLLNKFSQALSPEDVQLYYQIALNGRKDLPYAADEQAAFDMTLLRLLAFKPMAKSDVVNQANTSLEQDSPSNSFDDVTLADSEINISSTDTKQDAPQTAVVQSPVQTPVSPPTESLQTEPLHDESQQDESNVEKAIETPVEPITQVQPLNNEPAVVPNEGVIDTKEQAFQPAKEQHVNLPNEVVDNTTELSNNNIANDASANNPVESILATRNMLRSRKKQLDQPPKKSDDATTRQNIQTEAQKNKEKKLAELPDIDTISEVPFTPEVIDPSTVKLANQVDKWANMIDAMQLNGRLRQLAIHATISEESTDDSFILQLDQATKHLKTDNAQQLLENFVCDYLQRKVSVEINVVEQTIADPYQIQSHINDKRYEYAKDLLLKDEIVIQFQQQFQATIDEETIVAL